MLLAGLRSGYARLINMVIRTVVGQTTTIPLAWISGPRVIIELRADNKSTTKLTVAHVHCSDTCVQFLFVNIVTY